MELPWMLAAAVDATTWRGIERLVIVLGAICFGYLGFKLYLAGLTQDHGRLQLQSPLMKFALSGSGPGLFFMAFGAVVLSIALYFGGASSREEMIPRADLERKVDGYLKEVHTKMITNPNGILQDTVKDISGSATQQKEPSDFDKVMSRVNTEMEKSKQSNKTEYVPGTIQTIRTDF